MSVEFDQKIHDTLADANLQLAIYTATARLKEKRIEVTAADALPDYQELRTQANALKKHTIDNLDHYLEEFERNVEAYGGKVIYCKDATEVSDFVLDLAKQRGSKLIVKSKSMTTEEVDLNERLEHHGLESVETDLGEYILQLAHEKPYHIVAPALHKTRYDVADIFTKELNVERETVPEKLTLIARGVLREKFLKADIGISGANFLIADSGAVAIIENEGNARLTTSAPKIHIAVAGIEKVIPRAQDLAVFLKLLARSATGQLLSVYTSFLAGPRRAGEVDGPEEFYVVLLDNGRTKLLPDRSKRQSLYCIRCGACLNACPVYRKIGGHSFPWVYSGPIGAIITPQFMGVSHEPGLPFASSLCGACGEVCPVKIDIPKVLLELRSEVKKSETREGQNRLEKLAFRVFAWVMTHPRIYEMAGKMAASIAPRERRQMDPQRAGADERGSDEGVAERARPAAFAFQEFPRDVEEPLMSRDNILHKVRTALGRSAGQAVVDVPPVRLRVPQVAMEDRIALMMARVEALAGKTARVPTMEAAREFVAAADRGQDCGGVERAVSSGVRDCGPARRAQRSSRGGRIEGAVRPRGYRDHERGLRAERYRDAGDAGEPGGSAPGVAVAAGAPGGGSEGAHPYGAGRAVHASAESGGADQFDGADHGAEPHGGHRADSGARRTRAGTDHGSHRRVGKTVSRRGAKHAKKSA